MQGNAVTLFQKGMGFQQEDLTCLEERSTRHDKSTLRHRENERAANDIMHTISQSKSTQRARWWYLPPRSQEAVSRSEAISLYLVVQDTAPQDSAAKPETLLYVGLQSVQILLLHNTIQM